MLVLGDSMTSAEGVEAEQTYPKLLERALAERRGAGRYEVINAAVRGYGTDQELVLFERLIPGRAIEYVLAAGGVAPGELDYVAFFEKPFAKFAQSTAIGPFIYTLF